MVERTGYEIIQHNEELEKEILAVFLKQPGAQLFLADLINGLNESRPLGQHHNPERIRISLWQLIEAHTLLVHADRSLQLNSDV